MFQSIITLQSGIIMCVYVNALYRYYIVCCMGGPKEFSVLHSSYSTVSMSI